MNRTHAPLMEADIPFWFIRVNSNKFYPGVDIGKSWMELKNLNYKIQNVGIQFRDHIEIVTPDYAPGYFFIRSVGCWHIGAPVPTDQYFNIGWIENGVIRYGKWKVPELELMGFDERPIEGNEKTLVYNNV